MYAFYEGFELPVDPKQTSCSAKAQKACILRQIWALACPSHPEPYPDLYIPQSAYFTFILKPQVGERDSHARKTHILRRFWRLEWPHGAHMSEKHVFYVCLQPWGADLWGLHDQKARVLHVFEAFAWKTRILRAFYGLERPIRAHMTEKHVFYETFEVLEARVLQKGIQTYI